MAKSTGISSGNLIQSPISRQAPYSYRSGMGIIPSAEWSIFMDDFYSLVTSNAPAGASVIIDTGATVTTSTNPSFSHNGVLDITSDGASEGATIFWPRAVRLGEGKKFFMEIRIASEDIEDTTVMFGLSSNSSVSNPEDYWTTASTDVITFGVLDGDAGFASMLCDKDNAGTSKEVSTTNALSSNTWHTLGLEVGGSASNSNMYAKGFVDGQLVVTWSTETSIPDDVTMSPFVGALVGSTASDDIWIDYVRWAQERF